MQNAEKIAALKRELREIIGSGTAHGINMVLAETKEGDLEKILLRKDELRVAVIQTITVKAREFTNRFLNEEVPSDYNYSSEYKPKSLSEQIEILKELFGDMGQANQSLLVQIETNRVSLPEGAEGWFAIPNWIKKPEIFGENYAKALYKVLNKIKLTKNGNFINFRNRKLGPEYLQPSARSVAFFRALSVEQDDPNIVIVPAQFGLLHRGRSYRRTQEMLKRKEFCLDAFSNGIMLLTHPNRLKEIENLRIVCADEYHPYGEVTQDLLQSPVFRLCTDDVVEFSVVSVDKPHERYGSSTGFII